MCYDAKHNFSLDSQGDQTQWERLYSTKACKCPQELLKNTGLLALQNSHMAQHFAFFHLCFIIFASFWLLDCHLLVLK